MENNTDNILDLNKQPSIEIFHIAIDSINGQNNLGDAVIQNPVTIDISKSVPSSIIRIVPNNANKFNLPQTSSVNTFIANHPHNPQPKAVPSSNATADHEYVMQGENLVEGSENIIYLNNSEDVVDNEITKQEAEIYKSKNVDLKRHIEDDILRVPEKIPKVHSENCCCACRDRLETILQKQEVILRYLKNVPQISNKDLKLDLLPSMPFNDLNDFLDFDESLTNDNVLDQLITKLQRLLVSIDKKSVSNIMSSILTNDLCKKISWIGIKDTIAFQNTNMITHIIDVIQDHHGLDVDIIKSYVAEWLRRCSDRIASEIRKHKKKAQLFGCDDP